MPRSLLFMKGARHFAFSLFHIIYWTVPEQSHLEKKQYLSFAGVALWTRAGISKTQYGTLLFASIFGLLSWKLKLTLFSIHKIRLSLLIFTETTSPLFTLMNPIRSRDLYHIEYIHTSTLAINIYCITIIFYWLKAFIWIG